MAELIFVFHFITLAQWIQLRYLYLLHVLDRIFSFALCGKRTMQFLTHKWHCCIMIELRD